MTDHRTEMAIDAIARHFVAKAADTAIDMGNVDWSDYPEIGEYDWEAITERAQELIIKIPLSKAVFEDAYAYLSKRAEEAS